MLFKEFSLTVNHCEEHKKMYTFLNIFTYLLFFPCVLLQIIADISEKIVNLATFLRSEIIRYFMYLIVKKEN